MFNLRRAKHRRGEAGLESAEYAIIAGMIIFGLIAVVIAIGTWVKNEHVKLRQEINASATTSSPVSR